MTPSVAIAVSGLGRIRRGSETWAVDLAEALGHQGWDVHLYAAASCGSKVPATILPTLSRTSRLLRPFSPKLRYLVEQKLFTRGLLRGLQQRRPDVIHLTDPQVAWWTRDALRSSGPPVLYMDGLMLGPDWNWRFDHVQVLAPAYLEEARTAGRNIQGWRVIPHFINPSQFQPAADRQSLRARVLGNIAPGTKVALAVGDFAPGSSKRLHYIVEEFAQIPASIRPVLLLVGNATPNESAAMERFAREHLGSGVRIRSSLPRSEMGEVYQSADFFVHAALREPFGIVLLEAMASGLPVFGHRFPVTQWIIGDGGGTCDLEKSGNLAATIQTVLAGPDPLRQKSELARNRVISHFSESAVLPSYMDWYHSILGGRLGTA